MTEIEELNRIGGFLEQIVNRMEVGNTTAQQISDRISAQNDLLTTIRGHLEQIRTSSSAIAGHLNTANSRFQTLNTTIGTGNTRLQEISGEIATINVEVIQGDVASAVRATGGEQPRVDRRTMRDEVASASRGSRAPRKQDRR